MTLFDPRIAEEFPDVHNCAYKDKSIAEIVHDYAVVRGDLSEQYARDQLVEVIEERIRSAAERGWHHRDSGNRNNPYRTESCECSPWLRAGCSAHPTTQEQP